jgi:hypothetical protein
MLKSIVDVPLPTDSALEIGGVSWDGDRVAVNRVVVVPAWVVDGVELLDEQPAARRRPNTAMVRRLICLSLLSIRRISASG